jgi:hypothetical protein
MLLSRSSRFVTALIALFSILFMQFAVAAYACPAMTMQHGDEMTMSHCAGMDMQQPSLCRAHDQAGDQSLNTPELPQVQPFIATAFTMVLHDAETIDHSIAVTPTSLLLTRTTAPPVAIRNCCFRI